jgi:hypothetical protein
MLGEGGTPPPRSRHQEKQGDHTMTTHETETAAGRVGAEPVSAAVGPLIAPRENPGALLRACYGIGRRLFGQVPTPQTLMAHRPALMLGIGGLWSAIEYGGTVERELRALLQLHVATLYEVPY